jgi:hypothetical protein
MPPKILLFFFSLFSLACSNALAPPGDVQGTWAANFNLPGPSLVLEITQGGRTIAGGGTYAMEAGRAGTLQISGSYTRPSIVVTIQRDYGLTQTFSGTVLDSRHMTGTIADSTGRSVALTFTRR